ncbi:MAG: topoisomerase DNA-binding C4 zinc finger domain-containing protein, partial [Oscillospiraceae bacterium]|nr:topoisomerase DNA-binding C4 zinc finger domain-containing protein [Oscillospiraceae bacterium]
NNQSHIRKADNCSHTDTLLENKLNEPSIISEVPVCKRCGAPMAKKTAKRGDNKGNQFWGCSRFSKCRFILNIEDKEVL